MGQKRPEATEVFRQFAWHLAGTLAAVKARRRPRPTAEKR
jgi:hypothetical protein